MGGASAATPGPPSIPGLTTSLNYDSPNKTQTHLLEEGTMAGINTVNQQPSVRPKPTVQFTRFTVPPLQYHTPARPTGEQPIDFGLGSQLIPPPVMLSPYTNCHTASAYVPSLPAPGTPMQAPSLCCDIRPTTGPNEQAEKSEYSPPTPLTSHIAVQTTMAAALPHQASGHGVTATLSPPNLPRPNFPEKQILQQPPMDHPVLSPYPLQGALPSSQPHTSNVYSTPVPQAPMPSFRTPHTTNAMNSSSTAEHTCQG